MSTFTRTQIRVHIRWLIRRDMTEVLAIERAGFAFPWSEADFLREFRRRNCIGMVAEHGERIVGFMVYELHPDKLHAINFATDPGFRRSGVGRQMVANLVGKLSRYRRTRIDLHVRESNLDAQLFFRSQRFQAIDVIREHYRDTGEDGYLMSYLFDEIGATP